MAIATGSVFRAVMVVLLAPQLVLSTPDKVAPNDDLPAGSAILDRFVEVTGGRAAFDKLHNRVRHDRVIHVGMGFEDKATIYAARPAKRYVNIESEAMGNIRYGTDGTVAWYLPPGGDPIIEEGEAREAQIAEAAFDRLDNWRAYYERAECVKETTIDGKACHEVLLTPKAGVIETHYYDKETGLLVKARKTRRSSCMPPIVLDVTFGDYREVDGVRLPHKVGQEFDQCGSPRKTLFVTERIEHNVKLPPDRFVPPSSVAAAAAAKKIGELFRGLTGGSNGTPRAPCGASVTKENAPCGTAKAKAQAKKPCGDGS